MKKLKLSEFLSATNVKRAIALMMALTLLTFAGCNETPTTSSEGGSSSEPSQVDSSDASTDDASTDDSTTTVSSGTKTPASSNSAVTMTSSYINPLSGNISVDYDTKEGAPRNDAEEIVHLVDPSNLAYNYVGYAKEERDARLKEILNTPNTAEIYDLDGKIYYISPGGRNENDGLTPETAVQTIDAIAGLELKPGDAVLFERDAVYRMFERFELKEGVTYGSYGEGRKPLLLGSPKNFAQEVWTPSKKKNVWKITYMYLNPCGMFFDQGAEVGYHKLSLKAVEKNTDFYFEEESATLYLYCDKGNPSNVWEDIEVSGAGTALWCSTGIDDVTIDNISIRYTGTGGIGNNYNSEGIVVTNCEIGYTGGVWMGSVRGGNGIGTWCGGLNMKWNHNWIYQTFDSGVSPQGNVGNHNYDNISISNNLFEFNNADIESWESGYKNGKPLSTYSNNHYDNNIMRFTSLGWGTRVDDGGIRGIDGVHYGHFGENQILDITFNNNIIDCPGRMVYKMTIEDKFSYDNWERKGNVYYIKQSMRTTNALTYQFHWVDDENRIAGHSATNKAETLAAFAEFEPDAKVYWYK